MSIPPCTQAMPICPSCHSYRAIPIGPSRCCCTCINAMNMAFVFTPTIYSCDAAQYSHTTDDSADGLDQLNVAALDRV